MKRANISDYFIKSIGSFGVYFSRSYHDSYTAIMTAKLSSCYFSRDFGDILIKNFYLHAARKERIFDIYQFSNDYAIYADDSTIFLIKVISIKSVGYFRV